MPPPLPPGFLARPFAHRGLHDRGAGRVENSAAAFEAAIAAGYAIELDVQLTADGQAVVFHDATLDRLTAEAGPVSGRTAAYLSRIALAGGGDTIPRLAATLRQVSGRVPLLIELKDPSGDLGPTEGRLEAAVAADLAHYAGPIAVMSFNPAMVARLASLAPAVPRGLTTDAFAAATWPQVPSDRLALLRKVDPASVGAVFVSHDHRDLSSPRIAALRGSGLAILTWTVRSPGEEAAALRVAQAITFEGYLPSTAAAPG